MLSEKTRAENRKLRQLDAAVKRAERFAIAEFCEANPAFARKLDAAREAIQRHRATQDASRAKAK